MVSSILTLTDQAAARVQALLQQKQGTVQALRVGLRNKGCSGMSYQVDYADAPKEFEEVIEDKGVKIFIDPAAIMFLVGSTMDYVEDKLQSGFVFSNPNEQGRCGCGESFYVKEDS